MKNKQVLFVCTGNTCRSPMAEAALRKELRREKITGFTVRSAGLRPGGEATIHPNALQALTEANIPVLKTFAPRKLTQKMILDSYVVICMTERQHEELKGYSNVTSFYALAGKEIPDPYNQPIMEYRVTLRKIRECLPKIIAAITEEQEN